MSFINQSNTWNSIFLKRSLLAPSHAASLVYLACTSADAAAFLAPSSCKLEEMAKGCVKIQGGLLGCGSTQLAKDAANFGHQPPPLVGKLP